MTFTEYCVSNACLQSRSAAILGSALLNNVVWELVWPLVWNMGRREVSQANSQNLCEYSDHSKSIAGLSQKRRCSASQMQHINSHRRPYKSCSIEHKWTSPNVFKEVEHRQSIIPQVFFVLEERQLLWLHLLEPPPVLACGLSHQGPVRWSSIVNLTSLQRKKVKGHISNLSWRWTTSLSFTLSLSFLFIARPPKLRENSILF